MDGSAITIEDASAADTILSVKHRMFALNRKLPVRRQRIVYRPGPHGMEPLADDETLGGAGVAQDGTAKLDVLSAELTADEAAELGRKLSDAAKRGLGDDMLDLIDAGVCVDFRDENGDTALICAAISGRADCARLLVDAAADTEIRGKDGRTALVQAAFHGNADCVRLLIDAGADKEAKDEEETTALAWAAVEGEADCVGLLLEAGADKEAKDRDDMTAVVWAATNGHAKCAQLLLDAGADTEVKNASGRTALILAAANGHSDCVLLLTHAGADTGATGVDGMTALAWAAARGHADCARLLSTTFRISVVEMNGVAIAINDALASDTILIVKERVSALNRKLPVRRQRLVYRPGPHGMEPLADDETLGGAGVAQDGTAELDVLLVDLSAASGLVPRCMIIHFTLGSAAAISVLLFFTVSQTLPIQ
jgi:ankyrin repeat protein